MLPDIQPGNTKILYFFNCLLDGMHTSGSLLGRLSLNELNSKSLAFRDKICYNCNKKPGLQTVFCSNFFY